MVNKHLPETHNVYVVQLSDKVLSNSKALKLNPDCDLDKPPLYIGSTGLSPEARFQKHKDGLKANTFVRDYGIRLRPDMYSYLNPLSFYDAEAEEELLAKKLKAEGHLVLGGNPQLPDRQIKKADWKEYDKKRDEEPLSPQQARVIKRIKEPNTPGLLLFHGMGSGKSRAAIETWKALGRPNADVIVPAALRTNIKTELAKWDPKGNPSNFNVVSQQRFANPKLKTPIYDTGMQITDESQKAKNPNGNLYKALANTHPQKRLLLSGTPLLNDPSELGSLINLIANKQVLPNNKQDFKKQYFKPTTVNPGLFGRMTGITPGIRYELQNKQKLKKIFDKYVDYYQPEQNPEHGYPNVTEEEVKVPMGKNQQDIYNAVLGQAGWLTKYKVKHNLPPGKGELANMKAFLGGPRQVSNSTEGYTIKPQEVESPKIDAAFNYLQAKLKTDPTYKGIVYSNYINSLHNYEGLLNKNKIGWGEFSGDVSNTARDQAVKDYNANKIKALLISGAGAEGISTTGTRLEQILEPWWNLAKERQILARGVRFHSHDKLPPEKRNVLVQRYFSEPKPGIFDRLSFNPRPTGVDSYIHNLAKQKDQINQEVVDLIRQPAQRTSWWDYSDS